jgi:YD repeat-containing protein
VDYAYDALGRAITATTSGQTLSYQYDAAGNRTAVIWPDTGSNALSVSYRISLSPLARAAPAPHIAGWR